MKYPALFIPENKSFSVTFPDFPGCSTCGATMEEAVDMAHEALACYAELLLEHGKGLPDPTPEPEVQTMAKAQKGAVRQIAFRGDRTDFETVEVAFHFLLLERIIAYAEEHGVDPADFLAVAAREAIRTDVFGE